MKPILNFKMIRNLLFVLSFVFTRVSLKEAGCPVTDNPSQMFQCLTINPQAFIDLISKGDYKSFCHMANGYMTCMTTYVRDCLGGKAATGILEELQDLNLKCCISGKTQDCVVKNPALLQKCYSTDNLITLADGQQKSIIDAKVGDLVKAINSNGDLVDSEIVSIMHKNLKASGSHLVFVKNFGYMNAAKVKIGDMLRIYSNNEKKFLDFKVEKINYDIKSGYIAPLTNEGTILVNQIDTSCYAEVNSHFIGDLVMLPVKIWYKISKLLNMNTNISYNEDTVSISFYSHILYGLASKFMPSIFA